MHPLKTRHTCHIAVLVKLLSTFITHVCTVGIVEAIVYPKVPILGACAPLATLEQLCTNWFQFGELLMSLFKTCDVYKRYSALNICINVVWENDTFIEWMFGYTCSLSFCCLSKIWGSGSTYALYCLGQFIFVILDLNGYRL